MQLRTFVRGSGKGIAADRHVEDADQRGVPRVLVECRVQAGQVQAVRRAVQQRQASDVGRHQGALLQAGRAAVLRRHERAQVQQRQQQTAAARPGRLQDDAPRRGFPRARGHHDVGRFRPVHGPRFHPHGHAHR